MARLYVRQNGPQLLEFIRQTELLENQSEENQYNGTENVVIQEIQDVSETEERSWSISKILQWFWNKISFNNTEETIIQTENITEEDAEENGFGTIDSNFVHATVALAMLLTVAVVLTKTN